MEASLFITSSAFAPEGNIPSKYTCEGEDINPPLSVANIPEKTQSLVVFMDDPDSFSELFHHWVVWDIPPVGEIPENNKLGIEGLNDFGKHHYNGPCPAAGEDRYYFKIYALDAKLNLEPRSRSARVKAAMKGHVLASGELVGLYTRERNHL